MQPFLLQTETETFASQPSCYLARVRVPPRILHVPADLIVLSENAIDRADKLAQLETLVAQADLNVENSLSENTRKAYTSQWNKFVGWCEAMGLPAFPTSRSEERRVGKECRWGGRAGAAATRTVLPHADQY